MKRKLNRIWRQMTADKKKFGILTTMLAVGLLLWGRLILLEDVPKIATADPGSEQAAKSDADGAKKTKVKAPFAEVKVDLVDDLAVNLFAFRHDRYKPLPIENVDGSEVDIGNPGDDESVRRRLLEERLSSLRLQSVIQGPKPVIVVNGRLLRVGQKIDGFEVVSVNARSVELVRENLEFTLRMLSE